MEKDNFFKVYTLRNVYYEIKNRIAKITPRHTKVRQTHSIRAKVYDSGHASNVGAFYDRHHEQFLKVYGPVIQAFRTKDETSLLDYQIAAMGLKKDQKLLDAGCGIAAPAIYFAKNAEVMIDAITISKMQYETAKSNVGSENLSSQITVKHGDYHQLTDYFPKTTYDVVYFLESFGHSKDKERLISECWEILKPGGILYIKDLFKRVPLKRSHRKKINREIKKINKTYHYDVGELNTILDYVRQKGFILASLKTIDLKLEDFENLTISNDFQALTGMAMIEDWNEYIFPVDFFELKCIKPSFGLDFRPDRYFLQNIYYAQMESL